MQEIILSIGIDIGTSTTQLIFSRLTIQNLASSYAVPRVSIVDKEVIYRSDIYFTPLRSQAEIDADKVRDIITAEYSKAGIKPADLSTGAVIITGETARKKNASEVLSALSDMAGDFVVATAGPDLESALAAKGAGTDILSDEHRQAIANIDIGGGTSNIATFYKGDLKGTSCLDIGGRLIKIENNSISYIFPSIRELSAHRGIDISVGDTADEGKLQKICDIMADELAVAVHAKAPDDFHMKLYTNQGMMLPKNPAPTALTYSGGVADCIYNDQGLDVFRYGDIGILLGRSVKSNKYLNALKIYRSNETIRATVVGAGTHTTNVSGSTISYAREKLPIKNIPVMKISPEDELNESELSSIIKRKLELFRTEGEIDHIAVTFLGEAHNTFNGIQKLADIIIASCDEIIKGPHPLTLVIETDIGKSLGNAINLKLNHKKEVVCIDGVHTSDGDYIDIGEPLSDGRVVPVVIKTLIFNR